jgi:phosphoadenosine phosphosulfate reductase
MPGAILFDNIKTASKAHSGVIVSFSGGKDSVVTLDLCARYFRSMEVFFMYLVNGISFQESILQWYEQRYDITIHRLPHFMLSEWFALGTFRNMDIDIPIIKPNDIYNYMRKQTGLFWIAGGERINDSIWRRAMIKQTGTIDMKRGRIYPVAHWSKKEIEDYISKKRLKLSPEHRVLGHSFRSLMPDEMIAIRDNYPLDYERIKKWFPCVDATIKQHEIQKNHHQGENEASAVRHGDSEPRSDIQGCI